MTFSNCITKLVSNKHGIFNKLAQTSFAQFDLSPKMIQRWKSQLVTDVGDDIASMTVTDMAVLVTNF